MAQSYFSIILNDGTTPITLIHNPAGIEDFEIMYKRHNVYKTIFRSISSTLRFVKEGADYIDSLFFASGIDAECSITIKTFVLSNKTYSTAEQFEGIIDFSTYKKDISYTEVSVLDNSITSKLLAREKININLLDLKNIDGTTILNTMPTEQTVLMTDIDPVLWTVSDGCKIQKTVIGFYGSHSETLNPDGTPSINLLAAEYDETLNKFTNASGADKVIKFTYDFDFYINGSIYVSASLVSLAFEIFVNIKRYSDGATLHSFQYIFSGMPVPDTRTFSETFNVSNTLNSTIAAGDSEGIYCELSAIWDLDSYGSVNYDFEIDFNTYDLEYTDSTGIGDTLIKGFKVEDTGILILEHMGFDTSVVDFESTLFGSGELLEKMFLTNGKRLRNFPSNTSFNISFIDFFNNLSKIFGLLFFHYDNVFRLEPYSYFYDSASGGIYIDNISNGELSINEQVYVSKIMVGYKNNSYDNNINGRLEFNTEFEFATKNLNSQNQVNLVSDFRSDSIGIEELRNLQYSLTGGKDNGSDDAIFILSTKPNATFTNEIETGGDFTIVSYLRKSEQYYNFRITPKSIINANQFIFDSSLYYKNNELKYVNSKNEIELRINGVEELDGNYTTGNFIMPVFFTFDTILTADLLTFLNNEINTIVELNYNNQRIFGFIEEAKINLYKKTVNIKLKTSSIN